MFFVAGLMVGIYAFSNSIDTVLTQFYNSSNMGRYTLADWLHLPIGVVVLGIIVLSLLLLWGAEKVEAAMGGAKPKKSEAKYKLIGAGALTFVALIVMLIGQPSPTDLWERVAPVQAQRLENREVQIEPAELLNYIANDRVEVKMLDVRDQKDFNLFHIEGAYNINIDDIPQLSKLYRLEPSNTLFVVMSNDEARATEAWKLLEGQSVANVYILEGGINNWLATYNIAEPEADTAVAELPIPTPIANATLNDDTLHYDFPAALGAKYAAAAPNPHEFEIEFTPKVVLQMKQAAGGG